MTFEDFLNHYKLNSSQMMWFLGAGASRSAGMPSATDIIWDLKRQYYCLHENRSITDNDLSNEAVKGKIQAYLEENECPPMWDENEYAYYFKLVFGNDLQIQQKYLEDKLDPKKISINSGHRIITALLDLNLAKVIFTTNFDSVLENAFAFMTGKELHSFNLNGSYAALEALNSERFPIYAKMHGDFRYVEMKNLPEDLKSNDAQIGKCFINACSRYGLIVSGYSGRDKNVMSALNTAIEQENAFPKGLFWLTSVQGNVYRDVLDTIDKAKSMGINAHIIDADTFDSAMGRIWKVMGIDHPSYQSKIRRSLYEIPKVEKYLGQSGYPLIRLNSFPVAKMPNECLNILTHNTLTNSEFKERILTAKSSAILVKARTILAWGNSEAINKIIPENEIKSTKKIDIEKYQSSFRTNTQLNMFYSRAIAIALVRNKPLKLKRQGGKYFVVLESKNPDFSKYDAIFKNALASYDYGIKKQIPAQSLAGKVPNQASTFWMECAEISLEYVDGKFHLVILPDIWVEPSENRKLVVDYLKNKKKNRYNKIQNELLDAWKQILLGLNDKVSLSAFDDSVENNATFEIVTKTSHSFRATR
jgi:hypothetical protein